MDLATKAAIDRLRKIAQHGPALMSVSREDAQRILAHLDWLRHFAQQASASIEELVAPALREADEAARANGYEPHPVTVSYGEPQRLALGDELAL